MDIIILYKEWDYDYKYELQFKTKMWTKIKGKEMMCQNAWVLQYGKIENKIMSRTESSGLCFDGCHVKFMVAGSDGEWKHKACPTLGNKNMQSLPMFSADVSYDGNIIVLLLQQVISSTHHQLHRAGH